MEKINKYCLRCGQTQPFVKDGETYTCPKCGLQGKEVQSPPSRDLIGSPFGEFRTTFDDYEIDD